MYERTESINGSVISHGKDNDRIFLMYLNPLDYQEIVKKLDALADFGNYSLICAKVPEWAVEIFELNGYKIEAKVPKMFKGDTSGLLMSKFIDIERKLLKFEEKGYNDSILKLALDKFGTKGGEPGREFIFKKLMPMDIPALSEFYSYMFASNPYMVYDKQYIVEEMANDTDFFGVYKGEELVAATSVRKDFENYNAEFLDFGSKEEYRGKGFSLFLLNQISSVLSDEGFNCLFSIPSSESIGMNITFGRAGYSYAGSLIHFARFKDRLLNHNVWYKLLS